MWDPDFPGTGLQILCQWNVDSGFQSLVGFRIPTAYSGFQRPRFRIPQAKIFGFRNRESGFSYMGRQNDLWQKEDLDDPRNR